MLEKKPPRGYFQLDFFFFVPWVIYIGDRPQFNLDLGVLQVTCLGAGEEWHYHHYLLVPAIFLPLHLES